MFCSAKLCSAKSRSAKYPPQKSHLTTFNKTINCIQFYCLQNSLFLFNTYLSPCWFHNLSSFLSYKIYRKHVVLPKPFFYVFNIVGVIFFPFFITKFYVLHFFFFPCEIFPVLFFSRWMDQQEANLIQPCFRIKICVPPCFVLARYVFLFNTYIFSTYAYIFFWNLMHGFSTHVFCLLSFWFLGVTAFWFLGVLGYSSCTEFCWYLTAITSSNLPFHLHSVRT